MGKFSCVCRLPSLMPLPYTTIFDKVWIVALVCQRVMAVGKINLCVGSHTGVGFDYNGDDLLTPPQNYVWQNGAIAKLPGLPDLPGEFLMQGVSNTGQIVGVLIDACSKGYPKGQRCRSSIRPQTSPETD